MSEFFRPADVVTKTRNKRRQRVRVVGGAVANLVMIGLVVSGATWAWSSVRSSERFSISRVEIVESPRSRDPELRAALAELRGRNLFSTDLDAMRSRLASIDGIREATVEKIVPDGLRISVEERIPIAIWRAKHGDMFVDADGREFRTWSGANGEGRLPSIVNADRRRVGSAVHFLAELKKTDPDLAGEVASIEPLAHGQWAIVDGSLGTTVRVSENDAVDKWRFLHAIAEKERWKPSAVEYADLRFDRQIVVGRGGRPITEETDHAEK